MGLVCIYYPSEAISAGIATAISPTAAVAVSNDVLTVIDIYSFIVQKRSHYLCEY